MLPSRIFFDDFFDDFNKPKRNIMNCDISEKDGKYIFEIDRACNGRHKIYSRIFMSIQYICNNTYECRHDNFYARRPNRKF